MQPTSQVAQSVGVRARISAWMAPLQSWGSDLHALSPFCLLNYTVPLRHFKLKSGMIRLDF